MTDLAPVLTDIARRSAIVAAVAVLAFALVACRNTASPFTMPSFGTTTTTTDADGNVTYTATAPTPAEQALAVWVRYGAIMAVVGVLAMLPVFGGNVRTGAVIALGGVGMAATGHWLGSVTVAVPAWFLPALVVLVAAGMLWGYHVREKQRDV